MLVSTYLSDWLALRSGGLRPRTVDSYSSLIRLHICPSLGHLDCSELSPDLIRSHLASIAATGHTRTSELVYVLLSAALVDLPSRPMIGVQRPSHIQHTPDAWSDGQIAVYVAALPDHPHGVALGLAILCGLRRGEVCGLRWCDVDMADRMLYIRNQRYRLDSGQIVDGPPKSRSSVRAVPIPDELMVWLRRRRGVAGYVDPITPNGLDRAHRALTARLSLPPIPLHGLRHSMATACVRHGGDLRSLQSIMGHGSFAITMDRYTHPDHDMLRAAVNLASVASRARR